MALKLSLACALSALFLGIVIANAVALPPHKADGSTGWVSAVLKIPR